MLHTIDAACFLPVYDRQCFAAGVNGIFLSSICRWLVAEMRESLPKASWFKFLKISEFYSTSTGVKFLKQMVKETSRCT